MKIFVVLFVLILVGIPLGYDWYDYNMAKHDFAKLGNQKISYFVGNHPELSSQDYVWNHISYYRDGEFSPSLYVKLAKKATKTLVCIEGEWIASYAYVPGYDNPIEKITYYPWDQHFYQPKFVMSGSNLTLQSWKINPTVIWLPAVFLVIAMIAIPLGILEANAIWGWATWLTE